jgi:hypothetical protein
VTTIAFFGIGFPGPGDAGMCLGMLLIPVGMIVAVVFVMKAFKPPRY